LALLLKPLKAAVVNLSKAGIGPDGEEHEGRMPTRLANPDGEEQEGRMPMQLPDFPRWLRALFAVFLTLFFFNALYALAFFTAIWQLRIDPGVATLMGAIVGLGIVAWQARLGFTNLIQSQEHSATIETQARQDQQTLDIERDAKRTDEERSILMAALRAEMVGLMHRAEDVRQSSKIMHLWLQNMIAANAPNSKSFPYPTFNAPVYQANVSKIGLLGASLGADVVRVMTRTGVTVPPTTQDQPLSNEVVATLYDRMADAMREWYADLYHVAMRIRAHEEGTSDPGTLTEAQAKRQAEKEEKQKKEKAPASGSRRTIPPKRP